MFTQFNISPVKSQKKSGTVSVPQNDSEDIAELILAPFVPRPKILFENVGIGQQEVKKLLIKNPNNRDMVLFVIQVPSPELNINLSWHQNTVPARSEIFLEITWCPNVVCAWQKVLVLEDCKRLKRVISIVLKSKSVCPKKKNPIKRSASKSPNLPPKIKKESTVVTVTSRLKIRRNTYIVSPRSNGPLNVNNMTQDSLGSYSQPLVRRTISGPRKNFSGPRTFPLSTKKIYLI